MGNDRISITLNEMKYNARMDFHCIAMTQHVLKQDFKLDLKIPEIMSNIIEKQNWLTIETLIVQAIKRFHPQLNTEQILANMKYHERDNIITYVVELIVASMPQEENADKKKVDNQEEN